MKSEKWLPPSLLVGAVAGFLALNGVPFLDGMKADSAPAIVESIERATPTENRAEPVPGVHVKSPPAAGSAPPAGDPILFDEVEYKALAVELAAEDHRPAQASAWTPEVVMRCAVTMSVMLTAIFILLSKHYGPDTAKWAYSAIAVVIGYWL